MHEDQNCYIGDTKKQHVKTSDGIDVTAFTDTCAQTCVSDPTILHRLGLSDADLIPTKHKIISVTEDPLDVQGVLFVEITANNLSTCQTLYISNSIDGVFITKDAQVDIGILPPEYPNSSCQATSRREESTAQNTKADVTKIDSMPSDTNATDMDSTGDRASCGCLKRTPSPPAPTVIPFQPIAENRSKIEKWIKNQYASSAFNKCEHTPLPKMSGKPLNIHTRKEVEPKAVHKPIPVPHHWKRKVKSDLDRDVALGIIEPVPPGVPSIWCSRMIVVAKHDGSPRRTVDYQALNAATYRETHHTPPAFHQISAIPADSKKTTLDAWEGYHSLKLSPDASNATTFITEWGRYRYKSAPQGFHSAGDGYTKAYDEITKDIPDMIKIVDDSLHWKSSIREAFWQTIEYLEHCSNNGIIFNADKFHFALDEVNFAGFRTTTNGVRPTDEIN